VADEGRSPMTVAGPRRIYTGFLHVIALPAALSHAREIDTTHVRARDFAARFQSQRNASGVGERFFEVVGDGAEELFGVLPGLIPAD
jgi:hypothetical protein